jgi:hypothetical protein
MYAPARVAFRTRSAATAECLVEPTSDAAHYADCFVTLRRWRAPAFMRTSWNSVAADTWCWPLLYRHRPAAFKLALRARRDACRPGVRRGRFLNHRSGDHAQRSADMQALKDLGLALAGLWVAAGYNQERFAPLTGYSRSTLANLETGRQRPREFLGQLRPPAGHQRTVGSRVRQDPRRTARPTTADNPGAAPRRPCSGHQFSCWCQPIGSG